MGSYGNWIHLFYEGAAGFKALTPNGEKFGEILIRELGDELALTNGLEASNCFSANGVAGICGGDNFPGRFLRFQGGNCCNCLGAGFFAGLCLIAGEFSINLFHAINTKICQCNDKEPTQICIDFEAWKFAIQERFDALDVFWRCGEAGKHFGELKLVIAASFCSCKESGACVS